jgi:hypothetical protein
MNCGNDERHDGEHPDVESAAFRKAAVPAPLIPHSFCSPELLAHILYEKYCEAVPLYRQEQDFASKGVKLSRTTMANWVIYAAENRFRPIWERMRTELLAGGVIHADETVVQVLNEPGRKASSDSRMWVYCRINGRSNILFEYQPTRSGDHALRFLGGHSGFLVCDGFDGYNKLKNVTRCGCWAHVRRKFVDALPDDEELLKTSQAAVGVEYCNRLFKLEREFAALNPEERHAKRQEQSKPVLDGFFAWLDTLRPSGGTKLSKAAGYAKAEKQYLYAYLQSPDIK